MHHSTVLLRLEASKTIAGDLPPSSSVTGVTRSAAVLMIRDPVGPLPVNVICSSDRDGWWVIAAFPAMQSTAHATGTNKIQTRVRKVALFGT